jgi:hypothetical protein
VSALSCLSVLQSITWNNTEPTGQIVMKQGIWGFFKNVSRKFKFDLKSAKNSGYFTWTSIYIFGNILLNYSYIWNISDKSCRLNQNAFYIQYSFSEKLCRLWDNVDKYGRARQATNDSITWHICFACQITKTRIQTHSEYLFITAFPWNTGYASTPQCDIIHTLPVFFYFMLNEN